MGPEITEQPTASWELKDVLKIIFTLIKTNCEGLLTILLVRRLILI